MTAAAAASNTTSTKSEAAAGNSKPAPAAPRSWDWTPKFSVAIPEDIVQKPSRSTELPFIEQFFKPTLVEALDGKQPFLFVPLAFFQQRSDDYTTKAKKDRKVVSHGDVRQKLNDQFKKFQKEKTAANNLALTLVNFTGKEGREDITEAGVGMWVILKK